MASRRILQRQFLGSLQHPNSHAVSVQRPRLAFNGISGPQVDALTNSTLRLHRYSSSTINMATEQPTLHLFVIWAPDYTDEDAINRRLAVRSEHLRVAKLNEEAGYVTAVNGPLLSPESIAAPDAPKKMVGSMLVVRAASIEEVRAKVESDVYWTGNVWDKEKLVIAPFITKAIL
ncbi:hypothetical protein FRC18_011955 [Serendipita sp. 400]|nr:hypothetical protein FRC18_011955 [Serendipita sp. 400]